VELTTVVPFNDLPAMEKAFEKHPGEVAAVIVEPAMMNVGIVLPTRATWARCATSRTNTAHC